MSKPIPKSQAIEMIANLTRLCLWHGIHFALRHEPQENRIVITGVQHCNALKKLVPAFDILLDSRKNPYAELVINYE